jgi:hypothetical protein
MEQQTFNIETGMAVYDGNGQLIGNVTKIAGFGSTRVDHATDAGAPQVTEAQSGTGYIRVEQAGGKMVFVPFHGIKAVIPGHGVTLTPAMIDELRTRADGPAPESNVTMQTGEREEHAHQPRWWNVGWRRQSRNWRPHALTLQRPDTSGATGPVERDTEV